MGKWHSCSKPPTRKWLEVDPIHGYHQTWLGNSRSWRTMEVYFAKSFNDMTIFCPASHGNHIGWVYSWGYPVVNKHSYWTFPLLVDLPSFFRYGGSLQFVNCQRLSEGFSCTAVTGCYWMDTGDSAMTRVPFGHRLCEMHWSLGHLFPHGNAMFEMPQYSDPQKGIEHRDLPLFQWDFTKYSWVLQKKHWYHLVI